MMVNVMIIFTLNMNQSLGSMVIVTIAKKRFDQRLLSDIIPAGGAISPHPLSSCRGGAKASIF